MNDTKSDAMNTGAATEPPHEGIIPNVKRDAFLIVWLMIGFAVMLLLFAESLSTPKGTARWVWAVGAVVFLAVQALLEWWALSRWFPSHRGHNIKWVILLPVLAFVWLILQLFVAGSFSPTLR